MSPVGTHRPFFALQEYRCRGHNYVTIHLFCEGLSLCPRGHFFYRDGVGMSVFCFAKRADAVRNRTNQLRRIVNARRQGHPARTSGWRAGKH